MNTLPPARSDWQPTPANRELLAAMRRRTTEHLQTVLARVFARADDWLFDLAKKDGAPDGSPYLHAMRSLRTSRAPIERGFREHLDAGFGGLERQGRPAPAPAEGVQELTLVEVSELEEHLAANLTAEAVTRIHGTQLEELAARLSRMFGIAQIDPGINPVSALGLSGLIRGAHKDVDVPADVRMVLFKYYERELIHDLRELLTDLNARLAAAGFHPAAAPKPAARPPQPQNPQQPMQAPPLSQDGYAGAASDYGYANAAQQAAAAAAPEDRAVFEALYQLLHAWRPEHQAGGGQRQSPGAAGQRAMAAPEMMSVLSLLQGSVPSSVTEAISRPEASLAVLLKNELLQSASRIGLPPDKVSMSQDDEDAVDLVGMLFDVMFDERDFEEASRTLISRLVVPFVKAAVMDRRLFLYKTHPARRLLNSLAEACEGNRGEGPQERELLQKAESTVDRLIAEFNEDIAIFETLEQELRAFLDQHRRRVELAERRAAEAQRGQERLEQARDLAAKELEQRTRGLKPTPAMEEFLGRSWTHHLSMIALREGPESGSWQSALGLADRLLELVPREGAPAKAITASMHALREPIETVLASSGITGEAATDLMRAMADSLELMALGLTPPPVAAPSPENVVPLTARRASAVAAELKPRLEVVGGTDNLKVNDDDVEQMRALKVGTWIHIAGEDGKHHPVKLSWVSPISSRLMFVNRRGVRVLVASVEELAAMKQEGNLLVREQENVFDQVLHRVMGKLKTDLG